ncbi:MAG TPA: hypothetical protein VNJ08_07845 [Bacteriovoracaceae bacterium]|nr:hypothetical protein [Bacteriovoracaceae bacterium]
MKNIFPLLVLLLLTACGDTPFDEDYWDDDLDDRQAQEGLGQFSANLSPVSALSFTNADALLDVRGNASTLRLEMQGVPGNLSQGQVRITSDGCETLVATPPTSGTLETKNITYIENGTIAGLFSDISDDPTVEGKFLVVYAMATGTSTTPASALFPYACGLITTAADAGGGTTATTTGGTATGGTVTAGTTGTVTAGTTAGTAGGVDAGTTAGTFGGVDAGTTAGTFGGVDAGTTAGTLGGVDAGTTAGTLGGTAAGTTTGTFGGVNAGTTVGTLGGVAAGTNGTITAGGTGGIGTTAGTTTVGTTLGTTFGGEDGF